jgi:hypothetical protein
LKTAPGAKGGCPALPRSLPRLHASYLFQDSKMNPQNNCVVPENLPIYQALLDKARAEFAEGIPAVGMRFRVVAAFITKWDGNIFNEWELYEATPNHYSITPQIREWLCSFLDTYNIPQI